MGFAEPWAAPTLAAAIRTVAAEMGHPSPPDSLVALMLAQFFGAEGTFPGVNNEFAGTNNIGATQAVSGFWNAHQSDDGWGAFAHVDSSPAYGQYIGWYYIAPNVLGAVRTWLAGNWWGPKLLSQQPSDAATYARLIYEGGKGFGYFDGNHPTKAEKDAGMALDTAHDASSAAGQENVRDYANRMNAVLASVTAQMNNGQGLDPATASQVDVSKFGSLDKRGITKALYDKADGGGYGSRWKSIFGAQWPTWDQLVANNGTVWTTGKPPGGGGSSASGAGVSGALGWLGLNVVLPLALGLAAGALLGRNV